MMKNMPVQKYMHVLGIVLLALLFAACDDPSIAGATSTPTTAATATSAATPTQPAKPTPTTAATATSAATLPQPAKPTPVAETGKELQPFTGVDFTMLYPSKWQKTHKTGPGGMSGVQNQPASDTYGFLARDNITGFHIARRTGEQAVGGSINDLIGGELKCDEDKSVRSQVTIGGVTWLQFGFICLVASNNYEVRELVTSTPGSQRGQTVIMYGAYQQVGKGAVVPDFAHTKATYFDPMLASFKFN
jgi:hypothetical protein